MQFKLPIVARLLLAPMNWIGVTLLRGRSSVGAPIAAPLLLGLALLAPWTAPRALADTYPAIGVYFDGRTQNPESDPSVWVTVPAIWGSTIPATHAVSRARATKTLDLIVGRFTSTGAFPQCTGPDGKVYNHSYLVPRTTRCALVSRSLSRSI